MENKIEEIEELVNKDPGLSRVVSNPEELKSKIMKVQNYLVQAKGYNPTDVIYYLKKALNISDPKEGMSTDKVSENIQESGSNVNSKIDKDESNEITNQDNSETEGTEIREESPAVEEEDVANNNEERGEAEASEEQHEKNTINNDDFANAEVQLFNVVSEDNNKEAGYTTNNNQWMGNAQQPINNIQQINAYKQSSNASQVIVNNTQPINQNQQMVNNMHATYTNPQVANTARQTMGQPMRQQVHQATVNNSSNYGSQVQTNNRINNQVQINQSSYQATGAPVNNQGFIQAPPAVNGKMPANNVQVGSQIEQNTNDMAMVEGKKENPLNKIINMIKQLFKKKSQ